MDGQTDGRQKKTREKKMNKRKKRNKGGTNVNFYNWWQKCHFLIIGGINVVLSEVAEKSCS